MSGFDPDDRDPRSTQKMEVMGAGEDAVAARPRRAKRSLRVPVDDVPRRLRPEAAPQAPEPSAGLLGDDSTPTAIDLTEIEEAAKRYPDPPSNPPSAGAVRARRASEPSAEITDPRIIIQDPGFGLDVDVDESHAVRDLAATTPGTMPALGSPGFGDEVSAEITIEPADENDLAFAGAHDDEDDDEPEVVIQRDSTPDLTELAAEAVRIEAEEAKRISIAAAATNAAAAMRARSSIPAAASSSAPPPPPVIAAAPVVVVPSESASLPTQPVLAQAATAQVAPPAAPPATEAVHRDSVAAVPTPAAAAPPVPPPAPRESVVSAVSTTAAVAPPPPPPAATRDSVVTQLPMSPAAPPAAPAAAPAPAPPVPPAPRESLVGQPPAPPLPPATRDSVVTPVHAASAGAAPTTQPIGTPPAQVAAAAPASAAAQTAPITTQPGAAASSDVDVLETKKKKRARAWWEDFFSDDYLRTVRPPQEKQVAKQCDFIEASLGLNRDAVILDVGCGLGLQAVELAARGYSMVGYDLSLSMLSRAGDEAQDRGLKMNFLHGDMREMSFDGAFDAVVCLGTTFGYFDDETNRLVLERMYRALKPMGLLLLDVTNRDFVLKNQPNLVWFEGDGCVCMEETSFNYITSRLHVKRTVMPLDGGREREAEYSVRLYALHELGQIMHHMGFRVAEVSGREATPGVFFGADSPRMIILAERRVNDDSGPQAYPSTIVRVPTPGVRE